MWISPEQMIWQVHLEQLHFLSVVTRVSSAGHTPAGREEESQSKVLKHKSWWDQDSPGTFRTSSAVLWVELFSLCKEDKSGKEERERETTRETALWQASKGGVCQSSVLSLPGLLCALKS
jgi:hypothetical protein